MGVESRVGTGAAGLGPTESPNNEHVYVFPVTSAQQRLLFLHYLNPESTSYNIAWSIRITGQPDKDALERSLNEIVRRHEILRTTFDVVEGQPVQIISPHRPIPLVQMDLSGTADPEREALQAAIQEGERPIDLNAGPIVRTKILHLGKSDFVLLITTHHIVFDGWSRRILVSELQSLYKAFSSRQPSPLKELPLQYADYAVWQRDVLSEERLDGLLSYWKQQLGGAPTTLDLPTDRPRPAVQNFEGATRQFTVPKSLSDEIQRASRSFGTTPFMTLLAGFYLLLQRYSGQDDILVGAVIANRNRAEVENLIGLFANTLPLRTRLDGDPSFSELVSRVRDTALGAYAHQEMPFERLVEELRPERSPSYNPLFQVLFSLQGTANRSFELSGLQLQPLGGLVGTTAKFDLSFLLSDSTDGLSGKIEYNTNLFDASTIDRMLQHYLTLLEGGLANPEMRTSQLPLLTDEEKRRLLSEWNDTSRSFPHEKCIHELFEQQVALTPNSVAVVLEGSSLSYGELNARANQLAHRLRSLGVGPETLVGICLDRSLEMIIAILGVLKAGGGYVPLDPAYPKERRAFMLEDAHVPVLLTQTELLADVPQHGGVTICLDADWPSIATEPTENPANHSLPQNVAYVIFTSGSTGKPKGVIVTHANVTRLFTATDAWFGFGPDDTWTLFHSFAFDFSVWEIWGALFYGGKLIVVPLQTAKSPELFHELLVRQRVTVLNQTPSAFKYLILADQQSADWNRLSLRYVIFGGEALEFKTLLPWFERHGDKPALINMYGITETTVHVTYFKIDPASVGDESVSLVGTPIPDLQVYILDKQLQPVPIGVPGEIYVGGYGVARGYLNRPQLTKDRFIPNRLISSEDGRLYKTGDLARYREDGNIQYLGRIDHQVKIRGFRIELGEIESVLEKHAAVEQAVVVVREDRPGDKRLVAYVIPREGQKATSTDLRTYVGQSLPEYMIPAFVVSVQEFPLTPSGKINRAALPAPQWGGTDRASKTAPTDQLELMLVKTWERVLGVTNIGTDDNFFDLGGHSLLAVRLLSEVEKVVGRKIPLASLFRGSTIAAQAQLLRDGSESEPDPLVMEYQSGEPSALPMFAVAAPGVRSLGYAILARHLGEKQPFYKLQASGPIAQRRPHSWAELRALARQYVAAMRAMQQEGPYYLLAMCGGCQIAEQMILQLEAQGQRVALFAIFDTWVLEHAHRRWGWKVFSYGQRLNWFYRASFHEKVTWVKSATSSRIRIWTGKERASQPWAEAYWPADFKPPQFQAPIILFKRPKQQFYYINDPLLGWGARSRGGVTTYAINADHHEVLREPHVQLVSRVLLENKNGSHEVTADLTQNASQELETASSL